MPDPTALTAAERQAIVRHARHLCELGPRAVAELLIEHAANATPAERRALLARLARWQRLRPATLRRVLAVYAGGREFPPRLSVLPGGRP